MKNSIIRILLFLTIVIVPPMMWLGLQKSGSDLYAKVQYDTDEKRELTKIDNFSDLLVDGSLLTDFCADRAPFRSLIISFNRKITGKLEKPYENGIMPLAMKLYNRNSQSGSAEFEKTDAESDIETGEAFDSLFGSEGSGAEDEHDKEEPALVDPDLGSEEEHDYELIYYYPESCQYDGVSRYKCKDCGNEYEVITKQLSHNPVKLWDVEASYEDYGYELYICSICAQLIKENFSEKLIDESYLAPIVKNNEVILGRSDWLFLAGDGNLSYYTRENVLSDSEMSEYANALSELNRVCAEKGKKLAVIVAPIKEQIYSEYMPSYTFASDEKRTQKLVNYINDNTDVAITYPFSELKYASKYWRTYYKLDTHWNSLGAYIGFQSILKLLDCEVTSPFDVRTLECDYGRQGDLISLGGLDASAYQLEKDYSVEYKPIRKVVPVEDLDWYIVTNYQTVCEEGNGRKLFLVGDSYRINMIPHFSKEFSESTFVYRDNIQENSPSLFESDTIVIEAVERLDFTLIDTAKTLTELLNQ